MGKLTPRQERFIQEYLVDLNATQAAIRAGYSVKTAQEQSSRLLSNVMIQSAIEKRMKKRTERVELTQDMIIQQLMKMAFYDAREFTTLVTETVPVKGKDGRIREQEMQFVRFNENFDGSIIEGLSKGKDGIKMDMPNRSKALELLGKHLGMWTDKVEANVTGAMTVVFDKSMEDDE